ncbi:MAG TPA: DUF4382 domain-containing protein, partial [Gemmatimonadales bacterium]|nr:DUF4382 domain-containing protein [Gemmatimonadales bacterium]
WISKVYLIGQDGTSRFTITETPAEYDLLALQGGVTALLGDPLIPAGDYESLHLIVDSARVMLAPPTTFTNGTDTATMKVPSGPQTGLKVNFGGPVHIAPGQTDLVVDFDVLRSFVFQGPRDAPTSVLFKPVLHGVVADQAGSIAGTSSPAGANGVIVATINAGADTIGMAVADPGTGAYVILFLPPATYEVSDSATATGFATTPQHQTVILAPGEHRTGVDFTLP